MGAMKEIFIDRCEEWANDINRMYDMQATDEEVAEQVWAEKNEGQITFAQELQENTFLDTVPRENMANAIARSRTGMRMPCYGDSAEYKEEFYLKMEEYHG